MTLFGQRHNEFNNVHISTLCARSMYGVRHITAMRRTIQHNLHAFLLKTKQRMVADRTEIGGVLASLNVIVYQSYHEQQNSGWIAIQTFGSTLYLTPERHNWGTGQFLSRIVPCQAVLWDNAA